MKKNSTISGHLQVNGHALDIEYVERGAVVVCDVFAGIVKRYSLA